MVAFKMRQLQQLRLLIWKNFTGMRHQKIALAIEIGLPILMFVIVLLVSKESQPRSSANRTSYVFDLSNSTLTANCFNRHPVTRLKLAYAPKTSQTDALLARTIFKDVAQGFPTVEAMNRYAADPNSGFEGNFSGAVIFDDALATGTAASSLSYTIRPTSVVVYMDRESVQVQPIDKPWLTADVYPTGTDSFGRFDFAEHRMSGWPATSGSYSNMAPDYWCSGFMHIQNEVDRAIRDGLVANSSSPTDVPIRLMAFPYPSTTSYGIPFQMVALNTVVAFTVVTMLLIRRIVLEKELKLKEYMRTMGLNRVTNWCGHFVSTFTISLPLAVIYSIILSTKVLAKTDGSLLFLLILLYVITLTCFAFAVSCCFNTGNWATIGAFILIIATFLPFLVNIFVAYPRFAVFLAMLLPNTAMGFGFQYINYWEELGVGLQWKYMFMTPTPVDPICFADIYAMQFFQIFLYLVATWYIEAVFPGDEGVPQPAYFLFLPSYWFPKKHEADQFKAQQIDESRQKRMSRSHSKVHDETAFEEYHSGAVADIVIENLKKVYMGTGPKTVAIKNLSLRIFPNQITALLGHNGAGKSTTMAMLTGLTPATAGNATVKGYDIGSHIDKARHHIGLCPQYNVYINNLTVLEHLKFFCELKGRKFDVNEASRYLQILGLENARNMLPQSLSGGMKRKLCLAVALIGGSEIVLLDEPTSGMDPGARHDVWTFLQREKVNRTILLSTHYMEEADVLGDRIAILANGRLACSGSPLFLKKRYGAGYHITVAFTDAGAPRQVDVTDIVKAHCPAAKLESNIGTEAAYLLPSDDGEKFRPLFAELEQKQQELGVSSFGISVTTMDEVFIKVGEEADVSQSSELNDFTFEPYRNASRLGTPMRGPMLMMQHVRSQLAKRVAINRRSWSQPIAQIVIPSIFFAIAALLFLVLRFAVTMGGESGAEPALRYSLQPFESNVAFVASPLSIGSSALIDQFSNRFKSAATSLGGDVTVERLEASSANNTNSYLFALSFNAMPFMFRRHHLLTVFAAENPTSLQPSLEGLTLFFNDDPYHSAPIGLNALNNALLALAVPDKQYLIETSIHPYPRVYQGNQQQGGRKPQPSSADFACSPIIINAFANIIIVAVSLLAGSITMIIVKERTTSAKHLQFMAGLPPATYWASAILADFVCYLVPVFVIMICVAAFGGGSCLLGDGRWVIFLVVCVLHGFALIPMVYLITFLFQRVLTAFVAALLFVFFSTYVPMIVKLMNSNAMSQTTEAIDITIIFDIFLPHLCFSHAFTGYSRDARGWSSQILARSLVFMVFQFFLYTGLLLAIDYGLFRKLRYRLKTDLSVSKSVPGEDPDVAAERQRVLKPSESAGSAAELPTIAAKSLTKVYGVKRCCKPSQSVCAVDRLAFGVNKGECFGLLGVNGAGKTSTFQMLTGVLPIDGGDAAISRFSVKHSTHKARSQLGYCPQFDALIDVLSTEDTLTMFARIRGYAERRIAVLVAEVIKVTGLEKHAFKLVKNLSGGNRRKLSFAVALIGNPTAIILDEPTAGIDPVSRRLLWKVVEGIKQMGISVLLSSHSMEECEALCTRIAIMAKGSLKCLGTAQHLKSKFGSGYTLLLRVSTEDKIPDVFKAMKTLIPNATLKEQHQLQLTYWISREGNSWSAVFGHAEKLQLDGLVSDYSASQSTLEQVFLSLTHDAELSATGTFAEVVSQRL